MSEINNPGSIASLDSRADKLFDLLNEKNINTSFMSKMIWIQAGLLSTIDLWFHSLFYTIEKGADGVKKVTKVLTWGIDHDVMIWFMESELNAPSYVIKIQKWFNKNANIVAIFPFAMFTLLLLLGQTAGMISHIRTKALMQANKDDKINVTDVNTALLAAIKNPLLTDKADTVLDYNGINLESRELMLEALKMKVSPEALTAYKHRSKMTEQEYTKYLSTLGYDTKEQIMFLALADMIPPYQDQVRFAVREAWNESASRQFGHDAEFPEEFAFWVEKLGFNRDWAKRIWRSHWELPSLTMGFEMLHRRIVTSDDIDTLIKMHDFPPFWRDKLTQLSYALYTRVDIRRMYKLGVFDDGTPDGAEKAVYNCYLDLGYDEDKAENLTRYTILEATEERRAMSSSRILTLYKKRLMGKQTAIEKLKKLRVKPDDIDYLLAEADYELEDERNDALLKMLKAKYITKKYSKNEVIHQLSKYNLQYLDTSLLFETWDFEKQSKKLLPTKQDVMNWFQNGIIANPNEAILMLMEIGYEETIARYYIQSVTIEPEGVS